VVIVRLGMQRGIELFLWRSTDNLGNRVAVVNGAEKLPINPLLANAVLVERVEVATATCDERKVLAATAVIMLARSLRLWVLWLMACRLV
jgi:hypothetical protein